MDWAVERPLHVDKCLQGRGDRLPDCLAFSWVVIDLVVADIMIPLAWLIEQGDVVSQIEGGVEIERAAIICLERFGIDHG